MCGIAGYHGERNIAQSVIIGCLKLMGRRGPDSADYYHHSPMSERNTYLLSSRLKIIDLDDRSNQPFQEGSKALVYNGELYNYLEIKAEMQQAGHGFRTSSDTEVLMKTLDRYGLSYLERYEGMWSFAFYDESEGSLILSRDRFGEKPLYLYSDETGIYFGSEIKFIMALLGSSLKVNMAQIYRYMVNGYKSLYKNEETFFEGIKELSVASWMQVNQRGEYQSNKYWNPEFSPDENMSYDEAVNGVKDRLIRSVEMRLRADVPLAFCMSGGIDSNSLISIAKMVLDYDVHGFTMTSSNELYDEQDIVDYTVEELGLRHTYIAADNTEFLPQLRSMVNYHDAPVYTISYYLHWLMSKEINAHGYKISVSGTAADELFTGYYDHHLAYLREIVSEEALHTVARRAWEETVKPLVRNPFLSNAELFVDDVEFRDHIFLNSDGFARYLKGGWREPFEEKYFTDSLLRNRMLNEMFHESVPVILHEDDLNSMYFSIENRSPFLDRDLFDFSYTMPSKHLVRAGLAKAVLRDAMDGIVPEPILTNPHKIGFNASINSFLDVNDPMVRNYLLDDSPVFDHVKRDMIESMITKPSLPNSESKFLFYFLNAKIFLEEFGSNNGSVD